MKKKILKMIEENKDGDLFTLKNIIIDKEGILSKSKNSSSAFNWDSVVKICNCDNAIYIYVSSIQALIIPKRLSCHGLYQIVY